MDCSTETLGSAILHLGRDHHSLVLVGTLLLHLLLDSGILLDDLSFELRVDVITVDTLIGGGNSSSRLGSGSSLLARGLGALGRRSSHGVIAIAVDLLAVEGSRGVLALAGTRGASGALALAASAPALGGGSGGGGAVLLAVLAVGGGSVGRDLLLDAAHEVGHAARVAEVGEAGELFVVDLFLRVVVVVSPRSSFRWCWGRVGRKVRKGGKGGRCGR